MSASTPERNNPNEHAVTPVRYSLALAAGVLDDYSEHGRRFIDVDPAYAVPDAVGEQLRHHGLLLGELAVDAMNNSSNLHYAIPNGTRSLALEAPVGGTDELHYGDDQLMQDLGRLCGVSLRAAGGILEGPKVERQVAIVDFPVADEPILKLVPAVRMQSIHEGGQIDEIFVEQLNQFGSRFRRRFQSGLPYMYEGFVSGVSGDER